jgi:predicted RNA binding protein YcfA (HicA-like mRNA interferase family)
MPLTLVNRPTLIRRLRQLGFEGPFTGGRHQFMLGRGRRLILPNPRSGDIGVALLSRILTQAGVSHEEWESLKRPTAFRGRCWAAASSPRSFNGCVLANCTRGQPQPLEDRRREALGAVLLGQLGHRRPVAQAGRVAC